LQSSHDLLALFVRRQAHQLNNLLTRLSGQLSLAARDRERDDRIDKRLGKMEAASQAIADGVRGLQQAARYENEAPVDNALEALRIELEFLLCGPNSAGARLRLSPVENWSGHVLAGPGRLRLVLLALSEAMVLAAGSDSHIELDVESHQERLSFTWLVPNHAQAVEALASPFGSLARELVLPPAWIINEEPFGPRGRLRLGIPR
jgi:signal transduction histidine kinase